jgi:rhomboid protease GluP
MADCTRCGRKLPATLFGSGKGLCSYCRQAEQDEIQPGGHVSQLVPAWRLGPTVTIAIIGINVAVFLAMVLTGVSPFEPTSQQLADWGADYGLAFFGQPWRVLTYAFVHIGIFHIFMNMWCLWNLGRMAEQIYDKSTYLGAYLLCGVGGGIASLAWQPRGVTAGASGAVFGIAGLLITTFWMGNLPIPRERTSAIMSSLLGFAGFNLLFGAAIPGISNSAHIGGLFTGLVLGGLMAPQLTRNPRESRGMRWLILGVATMALVLVFQLVKVKILAGS